MAPLSQSTAVNLLVPKLFRVTDQCRCCEPLNDNERKLIQIKQPSTGGQTDLRGDAVWPNTRTRRPRRPVGQ